MEILINKKRRKVRLIGVRLYKEEYELISAIARKKRASRSLVAETILRAALEEVNTELKAPAKLPSS